MCRLNITFIVGIQDQNFEKAQNQSFLEENTPSTTSLELLFNNFCTPVFIPSSLSKIIKKNVKSFDGFLNDPARIAFDIEKLFNNDGQSSSPQEKHLPSKAKSSRMESKNQQGVE